MVKKNNTVLIAIIAVIVIIAVVIFLLTWRHSFTFLVLQKSFFDLSPSLAAEYNLTIPQGYNATLSGSYMSKGNVEVAVLNQQQLTTFMDFRASNGLNKTYTNLSSSIYYSGDTN